MKVEIVTPAPKGSTSGNRITAQRYARILRDLGFGARVVERWSGTPCDMLVGLHARKSSKSILAFAHRHPLAPLVVVLTGTDLYEDLGLDADVARSIAAATRVVVLQPEALVRLDDAARAKARVILQSAERASGPAQPLAGVFEVAALAHLRGVKDPFLAAEAVRSLPPASKLRVNHVGGVVDRGLERRALEESADNPRWRWLGERTHKAALFVLARAQGFVQTSLNEGGSSALAEAIVAGKPVVASRIPGAVGMLGADHPGYFEPGDARGLAACLERLEGDEAWRADLAARSAELAPRFALEAETAAWRALVADVGLSGERPRFRLEQPRPRALSSDFAADVRAGLLAEPKHLPGRYFHDDAGSELFEEVRRQPEYDLARAEDEILSARAAEIVGLVPPGTEIVELCSGSAAQARHLIQALVQRDARARYTAIDASRSALERRGRALTAEFDALEVKGVAAEHRAGLEALAISGRPPRLYLWLGSQVGRVDREAAALFLAGIRADMDVFDRLVIGIDRRQAQAVLEAAYDDGAGATARYNLHRLARLASEFDARIDPARFRHVACYDEAEGRIEMHLESRVAQELVIPRLELAVPLRAGERIHTENAYTYSDAEIAALAAGAGMIVQRAFQDARAALTLAVFAPDFGV